MKNLDSIRRKINAADKKIITLLAKRQSYMHAVGKYKKENRLAINQPARESEILKELGKLSKKESVDAKLTGKIFKLIFKNAKDIQKKASRN